MTARCTNTNANICAAGIQEALSVLAVGFIAIAIIVLLVWIVWWQPGRAVRHLIQRLRSQP